MSDEQKKHDQIDDSNVLSFEAAKIKRLRMKGHQMTMIEEFEILRMKLMYNQDMTKEEAIKLVTLTKYFMENGPTETFRYSCKMIYEKYMKPQGL